MTEAHESAMDQRIEELAAKVAEKAARYQVLQARLGALTITEEALNGAISVTVGQSGLVNAMKVSDDLHGMRPSQIGQELMRCMKRAQAQLASQVEAIMRATVGDDPESVAAVTGYFNTAFPQPAEPRPARPGAGPDDDDFFEQPFGRPPRGGR